MKNKELFQQAFRITIHQEGTNLKITHDRLFSAFQEPGILLIHKMFLRLFILRIYRFLPFQNQSI
jgi:hypothetical protein